MRTGLQAPPSSFAAPECLAAQHQLVVINLSGDDNSTVHFAATSSYSSWMLSPGLNASTGAIDPFSARARLNGELLPDTIDGGVASFLGLIPGTAARGAAVAGGCSMSLLPLSVSFVCHD